MSQEGGQAMQSGQEGVILFELHFTPAPPLSCPQLTQLTEIRRHLWQHQLIGRSAQRYGGVGYGNVSCRFNAGNNHFLISGSGTGEREWLTAAHYALVTDCDTEGNRVVASGPIRPSSESLTHGMLYALDATIQVVLHVHSDVIWQAGGLPTTRPDVGYGTPQMAREVARLFMETEVQNRGLFMMGGHTDGIIAFGDNIQSTGHRLLECYRTARERIVTHRRHDG